MGKLDIDPIIQHFSHQHPLELLNFQPQTTCKVACAGCELDVSGWIYSCTACNYCLHRACSQMPQCKNLQIDQKHTLKLISSPVYPEGVFKCNACGKPGKGFCYRCNECQLDIHTLCAFMPSSVNTKTHHHTLNLFFDPPYQKKRFQCDICKGFGSNLWLYRCGSCNFDAHMNCAMANFQSQPTSGIQPNFQPQPAPGIQQKQPNFQSQPASGNQMMNHHHNVLFDRNVVSSRQASQELYEANKLGLDIHYMGLENRLNESFLIGGGTHNGKELDQKIKSKKANESRGKSSIRDQSINSDTATLRCPCWWQLLQCFYSTKYERGTAIIKDGRM